MTEALSATVPRTVTERSRYFAGSARRSLRLRTPPQPAVTSAVKHKPKRSTCLPAMTWSPPCWEERARAAPRGRGALSVGGKGVADDGWSAVYGRYLHKWDVRSNLGTALVRIPLQPWRLRLPIGQTCVVITNRHLDLRQTLLIHRLVFRDHAVDVEQKCRQRVHLVSGQRALAIERHGAIDVIPNDRRVRRAERQDSAAPPELGFRTGFRLQLRGPAFQARRPVASRASFRAIQLRAFLDGAATRWELGASRTDGNVRGTELFRARRGSNPVFGRLCQRGDGDQQG